MTRFDVARAALYLLVTRVRLAWFGVGRWRRAAQSRSARVDEAAARIAAKAVLRAAQRLPVKTSCLDRAAAIWWMLDARGIAAELRIGVRPESGTLTAHAWVEHAGTVLLDEEASRFTPFDAPLFGSSK
ncbi:MAG TPA: lasso peptide biosynthesis B2 protein [Thermoanaerobaculia bacterium]|nr:lasso peptide biosynthesis B2 protein [Thermoanaerobaculia bacterium]